MAHRVYLKNAAGAWTEVTSRVQRLGWSAQENAEEGSAGGWSITLADPDMDFDVLGWMPLAVEEDSASIADSVVAAAITGRQRIARAVDPDSLEPHGRSWLVELSDMNTAWGMRLMTSASANRRAETDVARMAWLLGTAEAAMFDDVTTFVDTTGGVAMDANDYRGQSFAQVVDDCAKASGRNWFAWVRRTDPATRKLTAWYSGSQTANQSPLYLSNDPADWSELALADGTSPVWPISPDTYLDRDPQRVADGDYKAFEGGAVYRRLASTSAAFGGLRRDIAGVNVNVKSKDKAAAMALRELAGIATQEERVETAVNLPAELVTSVRAGMLVPFRATHLPGYGVALTYQLMRVVACKPQPVGDGSRYDVGLTLLGLDGSPGVPSPGHELAGPALFDETMTIPGDSQHIGTHTILLAHSTRYRYQFDATVPGPGGYGWGFTIPDALGNDDCIGLVAATPGTGAGNTGWADWAPLPHTFGSATGTAYLEVDTNDYGWFLPGPAPGPGGTITGYFTTNDQFDESQPRHFLTGFAQPIHGPGYTGTFRFRIWRT